MAWRGLSGVLMLHLFVIGVSLAPARAADIPSRRVPVTRQRHTLKQLRDRHVVKQQLDYSCGAAALATLMTYYFGDTTSEQEILSFLVARLSKDERTLKKARGFSLLDLKYAAQAKGYRAAGFKLSLEQLQRLTAPVIVFVRPRGYKHFAVLRGIDRGRVFLADPSRGNLRLSLARFAREWGGIVFVLGKAGEENLTTYPLALPRADYVQPELLGVHRILDRETSSIHRAIRFRLR